MTHVDGGDTFLIDDPGTSYDWHLWIVLSKPDLDPNHILIVNLTSWRADKDQSCILTPEDHRYVKHKTCVNYPASKVVTKDQLQILLDTGRIVPYAPVDSSLLERIREGATQSPRMALDHAEILFDQGLVAES